MDAQGASIAQGEGTGKSGRMVTYLTAPFRTLLSIDTEASYADPPLLNELFRTVALAASTSATEILVERGLDRFGHEKFITLGEDRITAFATPIFKIKIDDIISNLYNKDYGTVTAATAYLFDNTIGIIEVEIEVDIGGLPIDWVADDLESDFAKLVRAASLRINAEILPPLLNILRTRANDKTFRSLGKNIIETMIDNSCFSIYSEHDYPNWSMDVSPILWCNRTYIIDDELISRVPRSAILSRHDYVRLQGASVVNSISIHPGVNIVTRRSDLASLSRANRSAQYFYTLTDILNDEQFSLYRKITCTRTSRGLVRIARLFDRIDSLATISRHEAAENTIKFQAERQVILRRLYDIFRFSDLQTLVSERSVFIHRRLELGLQAARSVQETFVQSVLFVVGTLQVIEVTTTIFEYSHTVGVRSPSAAYGILEIVRYVPFDAIMNVIGSIILLGVVVLVARRRRR